MKNVFFYYIFLLVRALWLVDLAGRILLYGPFNELKLKWRICPDSLLTNVNYNIATNLTS